MKIILDSIINVAILLYDYLMPWWAIAGLITNILTEHLWTKRKVTKEDFSRFLGDLLLGPIGLGIYLYYFVIFMRAKFKHKDHE